MDLFTYFQDIISSPLQGIHVAVVGSGQYPTQALVPVLEQNGAKVTVMAGGVDLDAVEAKISQVWAKKGPIDVLITNFFRGRAGDFEKVTQEEMEEMWQRHVMQAFCWSQAVGARMKQRGQGKILHILSASAKRSYLGSDAAECATAGAMVGLTKCLAEQLAPFGVTVNAVAPGMMDCEPNVEGKTVEQLEPQLPMKWHPVKHLGSCKDIASALVFLSCGFSDYITGYTMDVNGGFYMD